MRSMQWLVGIVAALTLSGCGTRAPLVDVLPATDTVDTTGPYVVTATIEDDGTIVRAQLFWSNGSPGAAVAADFTASETGLDWTAEIPGQPSGTTVRYTIEVEDDEGHVIVLPPRALPGEPADAYSFKVGP